MSSMVRDPALFQGLRGDMLAKTSFAQIPIVGPFILVIGLLTFVFSTILGWSYYGERAVEYLLGKQAIFVYRLVWIVAVYIGSIASVPLIWDFADAMNALMALPNLLSLILLSNVVVGETRTYLWEGRIDASTEDLVGGDQASGMRL